MDLKSHATKANLKMKKNKVKDTEEQSLSRSLITSAVRYHAAFTADSNSFTDRTFRQLLDAFQANNPVEDKNDFTMQGGRGYCPSQLMALLSQYEIALGHMKKSAPLVSFLVGVLYFTVFSIMNPHTLEGSSFLDVVFFSGKVSCTILLVSEIAIFGVARGYLNIVAQSAQTLRNWIESLDALEAGFSLLPSDRFAFPATVADYAELSSLAEKVLIERASDVLKCKNEAEFSQDSADASVKFGRIHKALARIGLVKKDAGPYYDRAKKLLYP